jgi:hypothetical protein
MTGVILAYSRNAGMFVQADIVIFSEWPKQPMSLAQWLRYLSTGENLYSSRHLKRMLQIVSLFFADRHTTTIEPIDTAFNQNQLERSMLTFYALPITRSPLHQSFQIHAPRASQLTVDQGAHLVMHKSIVRFFLFHQQVTVQQFIQCQEQLGFRLAAEARQLFYRKGSPERSH